MEMSDTTHSNLQIQQPKNSIQNNIPHIISEDIRSVKINQSHINYPTNKICTSKYTTITFVPLNLFEQFSRFSNIYFFIFGLLQMIPAISTSKEVPVLYLPLSVIIIVTAIRDLFEDNKRSISDSIENNQIVHKGGQNIDFNDFQNQQICVGDVIQVKCNEQIPSDLVILYSSNKKGLIYLDSKNLDGETNLKQKSVHKSINQYFQNEQDCLLKQGRIEYEPPNPYLYIFQGRLEIDEMTISLNQDNLALRGQILKNTKFMIGVSIYTGHETKVMLNTQIPTIKQSLVEQKMNKFIIQIVAVQVFICVFASTFNIIWQDTLQLSLQYILEKQNIQNQFFRFVVMIGSWIMILMNFIPISLMITLDIIRMIQGTIIQYDKELISEDGISPQVQASKIIEDLGQINCIFSDKTGTLTVNVMNFKRLFLRNQYFGELYIDSNRLKTLPKNVAFIDNKFMEILKHPDEDCGFQNAIEALLCLSLCHSIVIDEETNEYQSSSQDELAFVNFAKHCGIEYLDTDVTNIIRIDTKSQGVLQFLLLNILEFTSDRKMMSVIVRDQQTGKIMIYSKGSDEVIFKLLNQATDPQQLYSLQQQLQESSIFGLRTLVIGQREIEEQEYQEWNKLYKITHNLLSERENEMIQVMKMIEKDLQLIGATAIEDQLQQNIQQTIECFQNAGINCWILTGDKLETAINIGYSSGVLNKQDEILIMNSSLFSTIDVQIIKNSKKSYCLIIEGEIFETIISDKKLTEKFLSLIKCVRNVVACRVSPKQKKEMVRLYKQINPHQRVLAIGDGANDVSMINEAHIGVGIKGLEGAQAARASDFSIGEFMNLQRLLFCHGRECYRRNCATINYNIYKNILYLFPMFCFGIYSGFCASTIYDIVLFQFYNSLYTVFPIIFYAVIDEEYKYSYLNKNPFLYKTGQQNRHFNQWTFWGQFFSGISQSCFITLIILYSNQNFIQQGMQIDIQQFGQMVFFSVILISNIKILCLHNTYVMGCILINIFSTLSYILSLFIFSLYFSNDLKNIFQRLFVNGYFYLDIILIVCICSGFYLVVIKWRDFYKYKFIQMNLKLINRRSVSDYDQLMHDFQEQEMGQFELDRSESQSSNASVLTENLLKSKNLKK